MWRTFMGLFVVAHGLVTAGIWGAPIPTAPEDRVKPPNPSHSWILGNVRAFSMIFGITVGVLLIVTGVGFLTHQAWWPEMGAASGIASLLLFAVFFTPWWSAGIAISIALVMAAARAWSAA